MAAMEMTENTNEDSVQRRIEAAWQHLESLRQPMSCTPRDQAVEAETRRHLGAAIQELRAAAAALRSGGTSGQGAAAKFPRVSEPKTSCGRAKSVTGRSWRS